MQYWTALALLKQAAPELGLPVPVSLVAQDDPQITQLVAFLNTSGNELLLYYPWQQFTAFWNFTTSAGNDRYELPDSWCYFVDQTQWDKSNSWPLLGPKSAQEWSWVKFGNVASQPRMRYRVFQDKLVLAPVPSTTPYDLSFEYIRKNWVKRADGTLTDMVSADSDMVQYHPWMMVKFVKLKFYQSKAFDASAMQADFTQIFLSLTGKDKGAPVLSLAPLAAPTLIGPWSVPDGSWEV